MAPRRWRDKLLRPASFKSILGVDRIDGGRYLGRGCGPGRWPLGLH